MEKGTGASEKEEPKFFPGWLRPANGGFGSGHHTSTSSAHSDERSSGSSSRNRFSVGASDHDPPRTSSRASSSFRRSASSNGSVSHDKDNGSRLYSSFGRSHRDRDRDKDLDPRDRDRPFLLDNYDSFLSSRNGKDALRRSQSMVSGKRGESWPRKPGTDLGNEVLSGSSLVGGINKKSFERDFPTLGGEERQGPPEIGRVASPGLSTAVQSVPLGASAIIKGDGWTSALVEAPAAVGGNGPLLSSPLQSAPVSPASTGPNTLTGLNMAETLAQAPQRVRTDPQLSGDTQRADEKTRKQCSKLIPVTPAMPRNSVLNAYEKSKLKPVRGGDLTLSKIVQQPASQLVNHTVRAPTRSDVSKASQTGNFQVLVREKNGISPTTKGGQSPTTSANKVANPLAVPSTAAVMTSIDAKAKGHVFSFVQSSFGEKRANSQAQNRNDFFNSLRKKTSTNHLSVTIQQRSATNTEKSADPIIELVSASQEMTTSPGSGSECVNGNCVFGGSAFCEEAESSNSDNGEKGSCSDHIDDPEEKAFLESLGWSGCEGEDYLTAEEVTDFIAEYENRMSSSKLIQLQQIAANDFGLPSCNTEKESEKESESER